MILKLSQQHEKRRPDSNDIHAVGVRTSGLITKSLYAHEALYTTLNVFTAVATLVHTS